MDRDPLRAAISAVIGAAASFVIAFVVVLLVRLFTDDPETQVVVGVLAWALAFGAFLWASDLKSTL